MYRFVIVLFFMVFILFYVSSVFGWHQNLGIDEFRAAELYRNNPHDLLIKQWQEATMNSMDTADSCVSDTSGTVFTGKVFTGEVLQGSIVIVETIVGNCKAHPNSLLICEDTRLNAYLNKSITPSVTPQSPSSTTPLLSLENLNTLDQNQLIDSISLQISQIRSFDKNKISQALFDLTQGTVAKGGDVMKNLRQIGTIILQNPSGPLIDTIIGLAQTK